MRETAGFLPGHCGAGIGHTALSFGAPCGPRLEVAAPAPTERQTAELADRLRRAGREHLARLPVAEIAAIAGRAAQRLLDRSHPLRRKAEALLPIVTGYDPETVRLGLTAALKTYREPGLRRFLAADFANPQMLDSFQPGAAGGFSRAFGPELTAHVWAGNVPGLPLWSLVSALLVKSASLGKAASAEPLLAGWFAETLAEIDPRLGACLAVVWWRGGDSGPESAALAAADAVVAYGDDATLEQLRARTPAATRFLGFGHRIGLAVVARSALDSRRAEATARLAARDVACWDQQGCYAPQTVFVERGGAVSPRVFAGYLAAALAGLEHRFPRRALAVEDEAATAGWVQRETVRAVADPGRAVIGDEAGKWSVVYAEAPEALAPSGLNRTVKTVAVDRLDDVAPALAAARPFLQTVAVAAAPEELFRLAGSLGASGATRLCALGRTAEPEAGWRHDGRPNLLDLVSFVDIDRSAEAAAEDLAPYAP